MTPGHSPAAIDALRSAGLLVDSVEFDGMLHRVPTADKPHGKNGAYIAYPDAPVSIWWQNWRSGESSTWTAKDEGKLTAAEREALTQRMEANRKAREDEAAARKTEAAAKAQSIYTAVPACTEHPYLAAKGVKTAPGLKLHNSGALIVPLHDEVGKIFSLQFIDAEGNKRFLTGGRKRGCFFSIGGKNTDKPLLVAEGLATALSLHECLGFPVLVAFDAGNLLSVAEVARRRYPDREIVLCADNDTATDGNPGVTKATAVAVAVGGSLAVPRLEGRAVDWNDLHTKMGAGEVRVQFQTHREPETKVPPAEPHIQTPQPLRCVNAYDFLSLSFPERELLLSPILPRQGLCMLHAMRGIGKTFISLSVAYAVASGGKVFDRWESPRPARVLFLDGEMPARTLQERLAALVAGSEAEPPDNDYLRIITPDMQGGPMPNLATREGQETLAPFLAGVDLVVLDNLATLARNGRSNDEESWLPVQGWLLDLRRRGLSVLMIHHQGKGGDQRGTSAKEDILDTVIRLARPKDYQSEQGARFEVHLTKARGICGAEAKPFEAQLFTEGQALTWTTRNIEDAELEHLARILSEGTTIRDAAEEMGISKSAAGRLKKKLDARKEEGRISQGTTFYSSMEASHEQ